MALDGRCISCGFLAKRPRRGPGGRYPGVFELIEEERECPEAAFSMVHPANVYVETDVVCFRRSADLPAEIRAAGGPTNEAGRRVLGFDRRCTRWGSYTPGLDPRDHLMERRVRHLEQDRNAFQRALNNAGRRLTIAALILAMAQAVTMTPDSVLYKVGIGFYQWVAAMAARR
jgi:hypothetical protein